MTEQEVQTQAWLERACTVGLGRWTEIGERKGNRSTFNPEDWEWMTAAQANALEADRVELRQLETSAGMKDYLNRLGAKAEAMVADLRARLEASETAVLDYTNLMLEWKARAEAAEAALSERVSSSHWQGVEDSLTTATTLLEQAREAIKWLREYASGFEMLQVARLGRHPSTEIAVKGDELTALDAAISTFLEGKKA